jgi:hypothetical protein
LRVRTTTEKLFACCSDRGMTPAVELLLLLLLLLLRLLLL